MRVLVILLFVISTFGASLDGYIDSYEGDSTHCIDIAVPKNSLININVNLLGHQAMSLNGMIEVIENVPMLENEFVELTLSYGNDVVYHNLFREVKTFENVTKISKSGEYCINAKFNSTITRAIFVKLGQVEEAKKENFYLWICINLFLIITTYKFHPLTANVFFLLNLINSIISTESSQFSQYLQICVNFILILQMANCDLKYLLLLPITFVNNYFNILIPLPLLFLNLHWSNILYSIVFIIEQLPVSKWWQLIGFIPLTLIIKDHNSSIIPL